MNTTTIISEKKWKKYKQRFRSTWLENELFRDWLAPNKEDPYTAHCIACSCSLKAKLNDIIMHRKSRKHNAYMANFISNFESYKVFPGTPGVKKMLEDNSDKGERCSSQNNLGGKIEIPENLTMEIQGPSENENDVESHSGNPSRKSISQGIGRRKTKYLPFDTYPRDENSKYPTTDDPELNAIYPKLVFSPHNDPSEDELAAFGKSIAAQMRKLPEEKTVRLTGEIQNLIVQARIKDLEEKKAKENNVNNQQIITVAYQNPDFISQSH